MAERRYFNICNNDRSKAECKLCTGKVSRGGKEGTSFNTSSLIKHLRTHHKPEYTDFAKANVNAKPQWPTLTQVLEKREKMSRDNPRAVKIHFIALDDQPLSVVET